MSNEHTRRGVVATMAIEEASALAASLTAAHIEPSLYELDAYEVRLICKRAAVLTLLATGVFDALEAE